MALTVAELHLGDHICLDQKPYAPSKVESITETQVVLNPFPFKAQGGRKTMTISEFDTHVIGYIWYREEV